MSFSRLGLKCRDVQRIANPFKHATDLSIRCTLAPSVFDQILRGLFDYNHSLDKFFLSFARDVLVLQSFIFNQLHFYFNAVQAHSDNVQQTLHFHNFYFADNQ